MSNLGSGSYAYGGDERIGLAHLFRSIGEGGIYVILLVTASLLAFLALRPLWQDTFSFQDIFLSRILLTATALPISAALAIFTKSRFDLDRFRINTPFGFQFNWSGKPVKFLIFLLLLGTFLYVFDPIGAYAASHSRAVVRLFFITDRATVPGPSANSVL